MVLYLIELVLFDLDMLIYAIPPGGPTLGGSNTDNTIGGAFLRSPGENAAKVDTILPLSYQPLFQKYYAPLAWIIQICSH